MTDLNEYSYRINAILSKYSSLKGAQTFPVIANLIDEYAQGLWSEEALINGVIRFYTKNSGYVKDNVVLER